MIAFITQCAVCAVTVVFFCSVFSARLSHRFFGVSSRLQNGWMRISSLRTSGPSHCVSSSRWATWCTALTWPRRALYFTTLSASFLFQFGLFYADLFSFTSLDFSVVFVLLYCPCCGAKLSFFLLCCFFF